jgi:Zn-dependent M28 family amino/carboxypeptidase
VRLLALTALVAACTTPPPREPTPAPWIADTSQIMPGSAAPIAAPLPVMPAAPDTLSPYRDTAAKILAAARGNPAAYAKLERLTDHIGNRIAGSPQLTAAIAWASQAMKDDGLDVHTEKVMVHHWVRNTEDAALVTPVARPLRMLGLGGSVGTKKGGITAPVVVVHDYAELEKKADAVKGAIVLYDAVMPAYTEAEGSHYGETVAYRNHGVDAASKHGAVGVLVRTVTARSLRSPHTGSVYYDEKDTVKLPAAAISTEDADLIARLAEQGPVSVHLRMDAQELPDAPSANVIGELRGKDRPDEVVVIGAHLDSWDVGQGAQDDGAGCVTMMQALATIKQLGLAPSRTIRVVLFVDEERGQRGGRAYAKDHAADLGKVAFALESDSGGFSPRGFWIDSKNKDALHRGHARLSDVMELARSLGLTGVTKLVDGGAGADVEPMEDGGVFAAELITDGSKYFDYHHSDADTLDKVDAKDLADDVALVAMLAYIVADMPSRLDSP